MSRPSHISNTASGRSSYPDHLVPRTPHSRSGRFEDIDLGLVQANTDDDQHAPLLASEPSEQLPSKRPDGATRDPPTLGSVLAGIPPVVGSCFALVLLVMVVLSLRAPDSLQNIIGVGTKSAPSTVSRPLTPLEYHKQCARMGPMRHDSYWGMKSMYNVSSQASSSTCNSTITYMLDGRVGLFADIALLVQAAAMAREQNRTFFIDDTYWNRGKWTDYFEDIRITQPGPEPGCTPPPTQDLVSCPRQTRHWIFSSETAKYHMGHAFEMNYEDAYARSLNRAKPIFNAARQSLDATIRPNSEMLSFIRSLKQELVELTPSRSDADGYVGIHLRRGDRLATSWKYHKGYVPIGNFVQAVNATYDDLELSSPIVYLASDSPTSLKELQTDISGLDSSITTFSLADSKNAALRQLASPREYDQGAFNETSEAERILATKGMVIDFALLSGAWAGDSSVMPGAIICTYSSNICKMSAVALGWDRAFGKVPESGDLGPMHGWKEIDLDGTVVPIWGAFELF